MVTCRFLGRLGNSMFQIAATIQYVRDYGYDWAVMNSDAGRSWESGILNCFPNLPRFDPPHRFPYYNEHPNTNCPIHGVHYDVCHYDYHKIPNIGDRICLLGFFQSLKYFEGVQDEVKQVFKLGHVPGYENHVSLHVRRGDYVTYSGSFPPITMDYIEKAVAHFDNPKLLVFSDDIAWCRQNITYPGVEFSEGRGELQDMALMASCGHHITANSSYSWWGAYLGHNPDKKIVCPSQSGFNWYGPSGGVKNPKTLIPDGWIQIQFR